MIDIVYQYLNGPAEWDELKYSLRSLDKNAKFDFKLWFVGDMPDWVKNAHHIPVKRLPSDFFPVAQDAARKMNAVILHPEIGKHFVYMYDDVYFINAVKMADIKKVYALAPSGVVGEGEKRLREFKSKHAKLKVRTLDALRAAGRCLDMPESMEARFAMHGDYFTDFETHMPKFYEKEKMLQVFEVFKPIKNRLLFSTLYNNYHRPKKTLFLTRENEVKTEFYGAQELAFNGSPSDTKVQCIEAMAGRLFMNHNNIGLTAALRETLVQMFPEKSRFER